MVSRITCTVLGCKRNAAEKNITLHRFPKFHSKDYNLWMQFAGKYIDKTRKQIFVCSIHFDKRCFDRNGRITRIKAGHPPTLFQQPEDMIKRRKRKVVFVDSDNVDRNPENNKKLIELEHSYCASEEACIKCEEKLAKARREIILLEQKLLKEHEKVIDLTQLVKKLRKYNNNNLSNS